jgi:hypothetical protein
LSDGALVGNPDAPDAADASDGASVAADRRFALWPLPPPHPLLSNYVLGTDSVVDKTTGLEWQKTSSGSVPEADATPYCSRLALGGHRDWRLPTRIELLTTLDYGQRSGLLNGTVMANNGFLAYWSDSFSLLHARLTDRFVVDSYEGHVNVELSVTVHLVRCVRGGPSTSPAARFEVTNGQARDVRTGIVWKMHALPTLASFAEAERACEAEGPGWRVPSVRELSSLIDESREVSPLLPDGFSAGAASLYWSSTSRGAAPLPAAGESRYAVDFANGDIDLRGPNERLAVRCVRDS